MLMCNDTDVFLSPPNRMKSTYKSSRPPVKAPNAKMPQVF